MNTLTAIPRRIGLAGLVLLATLSLTACDLLGGSTTASVATLEKARSQLTELTVAPDGPMEGYDRDQFPHWSRSGQCTTRETVLVRAGGSYGSKEPNTCKISGRWRSHFDGETWTRSGDVDVDHMVPLAEAWRTGAARWSEARREQFANDLDAPQLHVVTDDLNQEKGDKSPDQWRPPVIGYWPTYAADWVAVKHKYGLTITEAEKNALAEMLR